MAVSFWNTVVVLHLTRQVSDFQSLVAVAAEEQRHLTGLPIQLLRILEN